MIPKKYKTIGLLSDCIGQGFYSKDNSGWFVSLLEKLNKNQPYKYAYQNMSASGETIPDVFHRASSEAINKRLDAVIIHVGLNDIVRWNSLKDPRNMSFGIIEKFWNKTLKILTNNIKDVYIVSILPIDESKFPEYDSYNRAYYCLNSDIEEYNKFLKTKADEFNLKFIDIYDIFIPKEQPEVMYDASHPNDLGHDMMYKAIYKQLKDII